ncbi:hypothetical protein ABZ652_27600 [Micromonospora chalcea]|uniref:hypothetical protein n=1 Tax=Micromonospora chalcea TaxID=1874 RepID=UPI0033D6982C
MITSWHQVHRSSTATRPVRRATATVRAIAAARTVASSAGWTVRPNSATPSDRPSARASRFHSGRPPAFSKYRARTPRRRSRPASASAWVVLPEPSTPINAIITGRATHPDGGGDHQRPLMIDL